MDLTEVDLLEKLYLYWEYCFEQKRVDPIGFITFAFKDFKRPRVSSDHSNKAWTKNDFTLNYMGFFRSHLGEDNQFTIDEEKNIKANTGLTFDDLYKIWEIIINENDDSNNDLDKAEINELRKYKMMLEEKLITKEDYDLFKKKILKIK